MIRDKISLAGGARISWVNVTWPFARLSVQKNQLVLKTTFIGKYSFTSEQVAAIEKYTLIPLLGWGLRIHHNIPTYPKNIVFWCFGSPKSLIRKIEETGFDTKGNTDPSVANRGMPVRWQALVAIVVLWNVLFQMDMRLSDGPTYRPGGYSLVALLLIFIGSVAIWRSSFLRRIVLKPGRSCEEIKAWLYLVALVTGVRIIIQLPSLLY